MSLHRNPESEETIARLLAALTHPSPGTRAYAVRSLAATARERPDVLSAVRTLLQDSELEVRVKAARTLAFAKPDDPEAIRVLIEALHRGNVVDREASAVALGELAALARGEDPIVVTGLQTALPHLIGLLHDEDCYPRRVAAGALGQFRLAESVPALLACLNDPDEIVQVEVIRALMHIGRPTEEIVPALLAVLRDPGRPARVTAAGALANLVPDSAEVARALGHLLQDPDDDVRLAAAQGLAEMGVGAAPALPALIAALNDEHGGIYHWAVEALCHLGPRARAAVPRLKEILHGPEEHRRQKAAEAVQAIEGGDRE